MGMYPEDGAGSGFGEEFVEHVPGEFGLTGWLVGEHDQAFHSAQPRPLAHVASSTRRSRT